MFVMRVISKNSTDLVVTDLVDKMWRAYKDKRVDAKPPPELEPTLPGMDKEKEALAPDS